MANNVIQTIERRLEDLEYRRAYGENNVKYDLAMALLEARKQAGLTQQQLAAQNNVTQAYIAKLESGRANPTIGQVGAILAAMWVRPRFELAQLVGATNVRNPSRYEDMILDAMQRAPAGGTGTADSYSHLESSGRGGRAGAEA